MKTIDTILKNIKIELCNKNISKNKCEESHEDKAAWDKGIKLAKSRHARTIKSRVNKGVVRV